MIILISDVAEHFNCSLIQAAKITRFLMKATDVNMNTKNMADFKFCGIMYTLSKHDGDWIMVRSMSTRSSNFDDMFSQHHKIAPATNVAGAISLFVSLSWWHFP